MPEKTEKTKSREKAKVSDTVHDHFARLEYARDTERGVLGGVIAGLSNYTGWDVTLLRVLFVLLLIFTVFIPFAIAYLVVWICAPDEATTHSTRKSKATSAKEAEVVDDDLDEKDSDDSEPTRRTARNRAQDNTSIVARAILMIFGIIGFCIFVPFLIALIPATILGISAIASATIVQAPLFIATAILVGVLLFVIVATGLHISAALVTARLGRAGVISLVVNVVFAVMLGVAATTTAAIWAHNVGKDGIETTVNSLSEDINVEINDDTNHRINIDLGPIHVHAN